jgi:hypothetical protein
MVSENDQGGGLCHEADAWLESDIAKSIAMMGT